LRQEIDAKLDRINWRRICDAVSIDQNAAAFGRRRLSAILKKIGTGRAALPTTTAV
jgi:hypothetical protein